LTKDKETKKGTPPDIDQKWEHCFSPSGTAIYYTSEYVSNRIQITIHSV